MHSRLIVALNLRGQNIGTLTMERHLADLDLFSDDDLELAETLASHAVLAISNSRLFQAVSRASFSSYSTTVSLQ